MGQIRLGSPATDQGKGPGARRAPVGVKAWMMLAGMLVAPEWAGTSERAVVLEIAVMALLVEDSGKFKGDC